MPDQRKQALRTTALAARRAMTNDERAIASIAIAERLLALPELAETRTVLLHAALRDEVDLAAVIGPLLARGVRTLFPRVRGTELELVAAADLRTLQLGYRGIMEPVGPAIDPTVIDAAIVPGVAFDPQGGRLGQGGGHYDRLLPRLPPDAVRIGVCFACQVVPAVPREPHDVPMHLVVHERRTHRATRVADDGHPDGDDPVGGGFVGGPGGGT
jgi:5-formyltetrahydrofolate cyclo-ligase